MERRPTFPVVGTYVLSLLVTVALLVVWVVYVASSVARIREMAGRVGFSNPNTHWFLLGVGCVLFFALIVGLTYQLAQTLAARRYSRKQEEFVSNITHEMKSPLAAIRLHAQTLQEESLSRVEQQRSVAFVLQQTERMARLVDDVLESSRLVARKQLHDLQRMPLADFFTEYFADAAERLRAHGVELRWQVRTSSSVLAAPEALARVMDNLLDNAARFSSPGAEVRALVREAEEAVEIEVEDDGIGIPRKELPKIFDRFYQAGSGRDPRRRGTGLGLWIVAGLVREMRGEVHAVSVESRPGTRFVITLPRLEAEG